MARVRPEGLNIQIGRHTLPVTVTGEGIFWCEWEGTGYSSGTFKGLRAKMLPLVRDDLKRCEVPALMENYNNTLERITLIGIHASNGNVLYLDADGKTHQEGGRSDRVFHVLTGQEQARRRLLIAEVKKAERRLREWKKAHRMVAVKAVCEKLGIPLPERERNRWRNDDDDDTEDDDT